MAPSKLHSRLDQLGPTLREVRIGLGMRQAETAVKANLSRPQLSNIESGKSTISLPALERVANALGVTISFELVPGQDIAVASHDLPPHIAERLRRVRRAERNIIAAEDRLRQAREDLVVAVKTKL